MSHRPFVRWIALLAVLLLLGGSLAVAQQPAPPKYPPLKPDQTKLEQSFSGLDGPGFALAASDEAGVVVAACDGGTIHVWHKDTLLGIRTGSHTANVFRGHQGAVLDLAWNGGPVLASIGADRKLLVWNMEKGVVADTLEGSAVLIRTLALSPDGKLLAAAGDSPLIQVWDLGAKKTLKPLQGHSDWIRCLAFSPDSKSLLSGGYEGTALLWDVAKGEKLRALPAPPMPAPKTPPDIIPVTRVVFSPDGKQVLLGRADGTIDQVNPDNGQKVRTLTGHTSAISGLAYHPGAAVLASCSKDCTIRLWNPANGAPFKELKDHGAWVEGVAFLDNGTRLASVSADRTVRVWNLSP
jgi:WD40 repeat protein